MVFLRETGDSTENRSQRPCQKQGPDEEYPGDLMRLPCGDTHREVDGEDTRPEPGHLVINDVAGAQVRPLHDDHDRAEPDGQRREDVVEHDRQGELDAR
jgi:hypothetical protein